MMYEWKASSLGKICNRRNEQVQPDNFSDVYVGLEHMESGNPKLIAFGDPATVRSAKSKFYPSDVLYGKLRPYLDKAALAEIDGMCSTDILVLKVDNDVSAAEYLAYLIHTKEFIDYAIKTTSGVNHPRTSWNSISQFTFTLPPLSEQRSVASVLAKIQEAISIQQEIITRTRELKKALMTKLFTEGLNGKQSKETEIGPIPESWELVSLGSLMAEQPQNGLYKHNSFYGDGIMILRIDDFGNDGDTIKNAKNRLDVSGNEISSFGLRKGDIVINRVNSLSHLGKTALIGSLCEQMVYESNMMRFRVDETRILPEFTLIFLSSIFAKAQVLGAAKRAVAQSSINQGDVKSIHLPLPKLDVQKEVVNLINGLNAKAEASKTRSELLQDLFKVMLHQLMTGSIRTTGLS